MAKDAYYFSHDSNAKDDPKCVLLIEQLGLEGYGIFWVLVEVLRDQPMYRYPIGLLPALARRFNSTAEKFKTVVQNYGLFSVIEDQFFFSESLTKRMEYYDHKREMARLAGLKSAQKRLESTTVQRPFNDRSTSKVKYSKVKESKIKTNTIFIIPSFDEITLYCKERKNSVNPNKFFDFYESKGWMIGKSKMKDWKAAVRTWEKNDNGATQRNFGGSGRESVLEHNARRMREIDAECA